MRITSFLSIPESELRFSFSRGSGPGGQHVNKVNTRVTLLFDVTGSPSLNDRQRQLLLARLGSRISRAGMLRLSVDTHRSQGRNRAEAIDRFVSLLATALREDKARIPTRVPARVRQKRLARKKQRSRIKRLRSRRVIDQD